MWQYVQKAGEMFDRSGLLLERGYSGRGAYKNDPAAQSRHNEGPILRGEYAIGAAIATHGPVTLPLRPAASNDMCRPPRSAFLIHGDSIADRAQPRHLDARRSRRGSASRNARDPSSRRHGGGGRRREAARMRQSRRISFVRSREAMKWCRRKRPWFPKHLE